MSPKPKVVDLQRLAKVRKFSTCFFLIRGPIVTWERQINSSWRAGFNKMLHDRVWMKVSLTPGEHELRDTHPGVPLPTPYPTYPPSLSIIVNRQHRCLLSTTVIADSCLQASPSLPSIRLAVWFRSTMSTPSLGDYVPPPSVTSNDSHARFCLDPGLVLRDSFSLVRDRLSLVGWDSLV